MPIKSDLKYVKILGHFILIILVLSLGDNTAANGFTQNALVKYYCATQDCNTKAMPDAIQLALVACKTKIESQECKSFVTKEPEFAFSLKKCDAKSFCDDELAPVSANWWKSCGQGFLEGTGHGMNEMYEGGKSAAMNLGKATATWWKNTGQRIEAQKAERRSCNDLACKRNLVRDIPRFQNISDKDLDKWSSVALYDEVDKHRYITMTQQRQSVRSKSIGERAEEAELRKMGVTEESSQSLLATAWEWLEKKEANLQCLDANTRIEMRCWGAAYIIDPTMVAGAALKGGKVAGYVAKLAKESAAIKTGAKGAVTAAEQNALLAKQALADINAGKNAEDIRQSVGKIADTADNGKARLELAAQAMGRKNAEELSSAEKNWILQGHNTHVETSYGNIGPQKIRDKMNAGGRRPETISSADTRKLFEYGIMGSAGPEISGATNLAEYARKANSSVGKSVLGKKGTNFYESENRLAGEKLLRFKDEASLKNVVKSEQEAKELALGFFENDYKYSIDKIAKTANPKWQDYSNLSTAAVRTGRVAEAKKYLDLEVKAFAKDPFQKSSTTSLGQRLSEEARNNARAPQWLKDNVKKVIEEMIKERGSSIPQAELLELQRNIRNYLHPAG